MSSDYKDNTLYYSGKCAHGRGFYFITTQFTRIENFNFDDHIMYFIEALTEFLSSK